MAMVVRSRKGQSSVTDGPFTETKEQVGAFFVIEAKDMDEALRVAALHPGGNAWRARGLGCRGARHRVRGVTIRNNTRVDMPQRHSTSG
jgi:hypothetical protein